MLTFQWPVPDDGLYAFVGDLTPAKFLNKHTTRSSSTPMVARVSTRPFCLMEQKKKIAKNNKK